MGINSRDIDSGGRNIGPYVIGKDFGEVAAIPIDTLKNVEVGDKEVAIGYKLFPRS